MQGPRVQQAITREMQTLRRQWKFRFEAVLGSASSHLSLDYLFYFIFKYTLLDIHSYPWEIF